MLKSETQAAELKTQSTQNIRVNSSLQHTLSSFSSDEETISSSAIVTEITPRRGLRRSQRLINKGVLHTSTPKDTEMRSSGRDALEKPAIAKATVLPPKASGNKTNVVPSPSWMKIGIAEVLLALFITSVLMLMYVCYLSDMCYSSTKD